MRVALVTCLLGKYDTLRSIKEFQGFDAICFSDQEFDDSLGWTVKQIHQSYSTVDERIRICRQIKIKIHEYLPNYDIWIWADLSLQWVVSPLTMLKFLGQNEIATFKYNKRDCLYEEGYACIQRGKDNTYLISKHMQKYRNENFPTNYGLVETTVLIRKNNKSTIEFCNEWWDEIKNGSRRDQLSFNYVCWKLGRNYDIIPGHRLENEFTKWRQHDEIVYVPQSLPSTTLAQ